MLIITTPMYTKKRKFTHTKCEGKVCAIINTPFTNLTTDEYFKSINRINKKRDWYSGLFWTDNMKQHVPNNIKSILKILNRDYVGVISIQSPSYIIFNKPSCGFNAGTPDDLKLLDANKPETWKEKRMSEELKDMFISQHKRKLYIESPMRYADFNSEHPCNTHFNKMEMGFTILQKKLNYFTRHNMWLNKKDADILRELVGKNMRIKLIIYKFYHKLKNGVKKSSINDTTLHLEDISSFPKDTLVYIKSNNRHKYFTFTVDCLSNIIVTSLLQTSPSYKFLPCPVWPENPYNRKMLTKRDILIVYQKMIKCGKQVPFLLKLFVACYMNMSKFKNSGIMKYLNEHSSLQYVRELSHSTLKSYVMEYVVNYNNKTKLQQKSDKYKFCISCVLKTLKEEPETFTRLIRDYIKFTNRLISTTKWINTQFKFRETNPDLNIFEFQHARCMCKNIPLPTGNPFRTCPPIEPIPITEHSPDIDDLVDDIGEEDDWSSERDIDEDRESFEYTYSDEEDRIPTYRTDITPNQISIEIDITPSRTRYLSSTEYINAISEIRTRTRTRNNGNTRDDLLRNLITLNNILSEDTGDDV